MLFYIQEFNPVEFYEKLQLEGETFKQPVHLDITKYIKNKLGLEQGTSYFV